MYYYILKLLVTTILVVFISEISKRSSMVGAIFASIPLVSVLAMIWLYIDTKNIEKIINLSIGIFWLVLPSLIFFIILPLFLKQGLNFFLGMFLSIIITIGSYGIMLKILNYFNINL